MVENLSCNLKYTCILLIYLILSHYRDRHFQWRGSCYKVGMCKNKAPAAPYREQDLQDDAGGR